MESSPKHGQRLDVEIARRGLARSRSAAVDLIKRGKVTVAGKIATKSSMEVLETDTIVIPAGSQFVSRAGEKLDSALTALASLPSVRDLHIKDCTTIDVGASTGGFVECLLSRGARHVVAVDVGTDQLDASLRSDPRVESVEGVDIREFARTHPGKIFDLATIDVSFISLSHILPKVSELLSPGAFAITLVKPQFEVGKEIADRFKGVIADPTIREQAIESVRAIARTAGFALVAETDSPIEGEKGNRERFLLLRKAV